MTKPSAAEGALREANLAVLELIEAADDEDACDLVVAEAQNKLYAAIDRAVRLARLEERTTALNNLLASNEVLAVNERMAGEQNKYVHMVARAMQKEARAALAAAEEEKT